MAVPNTLFSNSFLWDIILRRPIAVVEHAYLENAKVIIMGGGVGVGGGDGDHTNVEKVQHLQTYIVSNGVK